MEIPHPAHPFTCQWALVLLLLFAIMNEAARNRYLFKTLLSEAVGTVLQDFVSILLDACSEVEFLDQKVTLVLILRGSSRRVSPSSNTIFT